MTAWPTLPTPGDVATDDVWGSVINQALTHLKEQVPTHSTTGFSGTDPSAGTTSGKVYLKKITLATPAIILAVEAFVKGNAANVHGFYGTVMSDVSGAPTRTLSVHSLPSSNEVAFDSTSRWLALPQGLKVAAGDYWIGCYVTGTGPSITYDSGGTDREYTPSGAWFHDAPLPGVTTTTRSYGLRASILSLPA